MPCIYTYIYTYTHTHTHTHTHTFRLERALVKADAYLKLTETACDLLSGDAERAQAAARKYTRLTDYVKDRIMDTEDDSLKEVRQNHSMSA